MTNHEPSEKLRAMLIAVQKRQQTQGAPQWPLRRPPDAPLLAFTFTSGIEQLTPAERAALPF